MKTNIKTALQSYKTIIIAAAMFTAVLAVFSLSSVYADTANPEKAAQCGSDISLNVSDECTTAGQIKKCEKDAKTEAAKANCTPSTDIENLIKTIINVISAIVGAVAVIMIIIGGFRFVTAGGDSNNVSSAKNTITYAIVGLIIVAFAQVIVRFVLQRI